MSIVDGSPEPLTYGEALVEVVKRISWPTEEYQNQVLRAVQEQHDLVPPEPDKPVFADPRDQTLADQDAELARLRAAVAEHQAAQERAAKDRELEELRAQLAAAAPAGEPEPAPAVVEP